MSAPNVIAGGGAAAAAAAPEVQPEQPLAPPAVPASSSDSLYSFDEESLRKVREAKPWATDPKYFKKVKISPSAAMKMLMHANSGVEKGIKKGGKPVEIMGLLLGRPDMEARSLVVTDVFPLPIEGAETRVLADDAEVTNYMIELGESLESTRKERFMGWYHSHPFEVEAHSHCFLSSTDLSTQLSWQRAEDPHGNPWLAIVVDPLRSLAKGRPEFGAFRAYPPEYAAPPNETPDGKVVMDDTQRVERWGTCWDRYCALEVEYFMSSLASTVMGTLTENFLWMRALSSTPLLERENQERVCESMAVLGDKLKQAGTTFTFRAGHTMDANAVGKAGGKDSDSALQKTTDMSADLAVEHCIEQSSQAIKAAIFGHSAHGIAATPMSPTAAAAAAAAAAAKAAAASPGEQLPQAMEVAPA
ncbi:COP9 signalosome complex subunit 5A [Tribonema minus]|uniref:COP9 signalosome complex subunit 5 n=1 Tax=Tribonema minus TaxID=303371 RepID=A0A836CH01_9STRA|nr:COP9 signalosome complex subunit 5A [Tribonema minus]